MAKEDNAESFDYAHANPLLYFLRTIPGRRLSDKLSRFSARRGR
jgi:hypothetical protein